MSKGFSKEQTEAAHSAVFEQRTKVDKLVERLAKERAKLDEVTAHAVSTSPAKRTWYHDAGPLDLSQAMGAADLSAAQLDALMLRYRKRRRAEAAAKPKRKRSSRKRATTTRSTDERPPGF